MIMRGWEGVEGRGGERMGGGWRVEGGGGARMET